jgi:hypothetical protein
MRSRWRTVPGLVAFVALLTSGCDGKSSALPLVIPTVPTPIPPTPSGPTVTLTGTVTEASGSGVSASVGAAPLRWTNAWSGSPRSSQADASGQYRFSTLPEHPDSVYVRAWKDGYVQQCAAAVTLQADATLDLTLTSFANVLITGLPTAPNLRHVGGTVYAMAEDGRRPLAGVWVGWEPIMDTVVADTRTDAQGRYRLCGLPRERIGGLFAVKPGTNRPVPFSLEAGGDAVVDVELE